MSGIIIVHKLKKINTIERTLRKVETFINIKNILICKTQDIILFRVYGLDGNIRKTDSHNERMEEHHLRVKKERN